MAARKSGSQKGRGKVKKVMREYKRGSLKSGRSGKKVSSRKQAVAIALSEARESGARIPRKGASKRKGGAKKSAAKKTTRKRATKRRSS